MAPFEPLQQLALRLATYHVLEVAVELAIIWVVVFAVWRFVRGTRAVGALKGVLMLVVLTLALRLFIPGERFQRLAFLYDNFLGFAAVALVIVFQPELRRAMVRIGETPLFRSTPPDVARAVDAIASACNLLSKSKFGAIIAIERQVGLRETIEGGTLLNADISADLIQSIFWPSNPLHDMGAVVRGAKIIAAGVPFPLAEPEETPDPRMGTRHRAAIGLSRASDALVVVVSEETGSISLAERGRIERWLTPDALRAELIRRLMPTTERNGVRELVASDSVSADADGPSEPRLARAGGEAA